MSLSIPRDVSNSTRALKYEMFFLSLSFPVANEVGNRQETPPPPFCYSLYNLSSSALQWSSLASMHSENKRESLIAYKRFKFQTKNSNIQPHLKVCKTNNRNSQAWFFNLTKLSKPNDIFYSNNWKKLLHKQYQHNSTHATSISLTSKKKWNK